MSPEELEKAKVELEQMQYAARHQGQLSFDPMSTRQWVAEYAQKLIDALEEAWGQPDY